MAGFALGRFSCILLRVKLQALARCSIRASRRAMCRHGVYCALLMTVATSSMTDWHHGRQISGGGRSTCSAAIASGLSPASIT
jgi:hypothetical protein